MAKSLSFSPFQIASPVLLLFCLVLFFLPWVEVQCVPSKTAAKDMPKEQVEKAKKEFGIDPTQPISLATQSGLQIATGGSSPGSDVKRVMEKFKEQAKKMGASEDAGDVGPLKSKDKDETKGAPLLFLYPLALLAGIVCGLLPFMPMVRRIVTAGCCAAALGVVGLQAIIGFPIEESVGKQAEQMKGMGMGFGFGGPGPGAAMPRGKAPADKKGGAKDTKPDAKDQDTIRVSWQFALYLTFLLLLTAGGTAFLDAVVGGGRNAKRRKSRYDDEEDEEDDEDDRPRKRRRGEDDDEEDERARKKKGRDEDDEDERPRKRRRDEDEDDERPRKKARADRDEEEEERPRKKKPQPDYEELDEPAPLPPPAPKPGTAQRPAAPPSPPPAPAPAGGNPFAFDDDEPKPKKKPRPRDEDDEDDRPRKKRRRDDD